MEDVIGQHGLLERHEGHPGQADQVLALQPLVGRRSRRGA